MEHWANLWIYKQTWICLTSDIQGWLWPKAGTATALCACQSKVNIWAKFEETVSRVIYLKSWNKKNEIWPSMLTFGHLSWDFCVYLLLFMRTLEQNLKKKSKGIKFLKSDTKMRDIWPTKLTLTSRQHDTAEFQVPIIVLWVENLRKI
jgi:hypothetical protein